jgi:hypothetical protein
MSINPDREDGTYADSPLVIIPIQGDLRFIERGVPTENEHVLKKVRILQRYEWSYVKGGFGWYDIPLADE